MKKLLTVSILVLLLSCGTTPMEPTQKQQEFAEKLLEQPNILKTKWYTTSILQVWIELDALGLNPELKAKELVDQIAAAGLEYTEEDLCVNLYYSKLNKLADTCVWK